ncbi:hypothetical protein FE257_009197 [Aspergillus nanangensis]|uniref:DUF1857-domain-containing protein n=1 Tax=Aspergillus nanangensis TaxID=2582783 RepID=A0AAD4CKX6_ASPNN|nr:hypothetical protein FE257_009197 [Aspergillus nanangensis]
MVCIAVSYTAPVNVAGVKALTIEQLWAGLQYKVRHAEVFVPTIKSCKVLEDRGNEVERAVTFKDFGNVLTSGNTMTETVKSYPHSQVDFVQGDGTVVHNVVSQGAQGSDDLYLTYAFLWQRPDIQAGTPEERDARDTFQRQAKMAVEKSIEVTRELLATGKI